MQVNEALVRHIARLARLKVTDEEAHNLEGELTSILDWVEQLEEVDTEGVAPMTCVVETSMKMREDKVTDGDYPDKIVQNAPQKDGHFFMVPKVVE